MLPSTNTCQSLSVSGWIPGAQTKPQCVVGIHAVTTKNSILLPSSLVLSNLPQSSDGGSDGSGRWGSEGVCTSSVDFVTWLALPDTDGSSLDGVLNRISVDVLECSVALLHNQGFMYRGARTFPQEGQLYRACWVISIFLTLDNYQN